MRCKKCGTLLKDGQTVCPNCGEQNAQENTPAVSASGARLCHSCGNELPDGVSFCPKCGTKVVPVTAPAAPAAEAAKCSSCGAALKPGAKFCPACGAKAGEKPAEAPAAPVAAAPAAPVADEAAKCSSCGAALKPGAKFCPVCGAKAGEKPAEAKSEPAPAEEAKPAETPVVPAAAAPVADEAAKCSSCGAALKPGAKFCPVCGAKAGEKPAEAKSEPAPAEEAKPAETPVAPAAAAPVADEAAKCPACGAALKPGAKFCPVCGAKAGEKPAEEKSESAPAEEAKPAEAPAAAEPTKCPTCGSALKPGAKFCPVCGAKIGDAAASSAAPATGTAATAASPAASSAAAAPAAPVSNIPAAPAAPKKKINPLIIILPIAGVVLIAVAVIIIVAIIANRAPEVSIDEYVSVSYEGYDGNGRAYVTFDDRKFRDDYANQLRYGKDPKTSSISYYIDYQNPATYVAYFVGDAYSLNKSEGLKNGDKIKLKWDITDTMKENINEYVKCDLKYSKELEFTVSGLKELPEVDPFDYVDVTFSGRDPYGNAYYNTKHSDDYYFSFKFDKSENLANGDEVTLSVVAYDEKQDPEKYYAESYNVRITKTKKKYKVSGLEKVVAAAADIPEGALNEMKQTAKENISNDLRYSSYATYKSDEYIGVVVLADPSGSTWSSNYYYLVSRVNVSVKNKDSKGKDFDFSYYTYTRFTDIIIKSDGSYSMDSYNTTGYNSIRVDNSYAYLSGYETYSALYDAIADSSYKIDSNITTDPDEGRTKPTEVSEESSRPEESSKTEESSNSEESSRSEESSKTDESSKPETSGSLPTLSAFIEEQIGPSVAESLSNDDMSAKLSAEDENTMLFLFTLKKDVKESEIKQFKEQMETQYPDDDSSIKDMLTTLEQMTTATDAKIIIRLVSKDGKTIYEHKYTK